VTEFLEVMERREGDELVGWVGGLALPCSCLAAHLLGELLMHGFDLSRVEGRSFEMQPGDAALAFGFFLDVLRFSPSSMWPYFLEKERAGNLDACIDLRMRGGRRDFIVFEAGGVHVEAPSDRRVDCHISIDPRLAMLTGFGRISTARAAVTGRVLAWGRRPLLAFRFANLIRNP
jgi:hypothetical protein